MCGVRYVWREICVGYVWCEIRQQSSEEPCDETSFGNNGMFTISSGARFLPSRVCWIVVHHSLDG